MTEDKDVIIQRHDQDFEGRWPEAEQGSVGRVGEPSPSVSGTGPGSELRCVSCPGTCGQECDRSGDHDPQREGPTEDPQVLSLYLVTCERFDWEAQVWLEGDRIYSASPPLGHMVGLTRQDLHKRARDHGWGVVGAAP